MVGLQWSIFIVCTVDTFRMDIRSVTVSGARPLTSVEDLHSSSNNVEFSGDFRLCDDDEDCGVISGSGEMVAPWPSQVDGDSVTPSTSGRQHLVYVEQRTSPQSRVTTAEDSGGASTSGESLVIVVEMTERSPSRHPLSPTLAPLQSTTAGRPPPYRLVTKAASPGVGAVGSAAERVAINVGLIVGIVGAVSMLVVMLAALLLCRPRPHVAQLSSSTHVDDHKLKLSAMSNRDRSVHSVVVHANSLGRGSLPTAAAGRLSTADEWFV